MIFVKSEHRELYVSFQLSPCSYVSIFWLLSGVRPVDDKQASSSNQTDPYKLELASRLASVLSSMEL